jgi:uncharacterized protein YbjT (DUF2867 family)
LAVLVVGATGFIGSAVVARLSTLGVPIVATTRGGPRTWASSVRWEKLDLRRATTPEAWAPLIEGVEAVVNCAGVLQDNVRDSTTAVHTLAPAALFAACESAGVRRVIHVSAIGADREALSPFSATKQAAEIDLQGRDLDWVILRPSVVLGRTAYGGGALFRGLAALPLALTPPNAGPLQVVQLDEVVETIVRLLDPKAPAKIALDLAGPERLAFEDVVAAFRSWLGWKPARRLRGAPALMSLGYAAGDFAGLLGWRSPIRSTARREMVRGATGDPTPWIEATGIQPRPLGAALAAEPPSVQERWFARIYLLKPSVFTVFSLFWIGTGLISLGPGYEIGVRLMEQGGAGPLSGPSVIAGALTDLVVGALIAFRPTTRLGLWAAMGVSVFYILAGTAILPILWADPLGPMWKIWPILALNIVALAILDER